MRIFTGYYGNHRQYKKNGLFLVSISIGKFKYGEIDGDIDELKPTYVMLKNGYNEQDFQKNILSKTSPQTIVNKLKTIGNGKNVVLLCYEKNENDCHRNYVSRWLNENGVACEEYIVRPSQTSLF